MLSLIKGHTIIRSSDWTEDGFTFPANESERCAEPYCHSKVIEYNASKDQISGSEIHGPELVTQAKFRTLTAHDPAVLRSLPSIDRLVSGMLSRS